MDSWSGLVGTALGSSITLVVTWWGTRSRRGEENRKAYGPFVRAARALLREPARIAEFVDAAADLEFLAPKRALEQLPMVRTAAERFVRLAESNAPNAPVVGEARGEFEAALAELIALLR
jgi:hypothetical protein